MRQAGAPLVSVVTPSYNQGAYIERTILSVLRQDYPHIEYIVMDAMSNDGTAQVLRKYESDISILVREKDDGQADAINKGLALSHGHIHAYLNADDCFASSTVISDAVAQFLASQASVVYGRRHTVDSTGMFHHSYPFRVFDGELLKKIDFLPQECVFWTRDIYERAGGIVNKDFHFAMDYELWLRFLEQGASFCAVDKIYGLFRYHQDQKSMTTLRRVGLPEIAKLQIRYGGVSLSEAKIKSLTQSYWYGVDQEKYPEQYLASKRAWELNLESTVRMFADSRLDDWVFSSPQKFMVS